MRADSSGADLVAYFREMAAKTDLPHGSEYGISCDHEATLAVLAHIDGLHATIARLCAEAEQHVETLAFNRTELDRRVRGARDNGYRIGFEAGRSAGRDGGEP